MMQSYEWYLTLVKPSWAPPSWLFGPVWSVLYVVIFITFGVVGFRWYSGLLPGIVALPFLLNLIANAAFTPLQFGLKSNTLASVDILIVLLTLVWGMVALWYAAPELRWIVIANIPYLLWVSFATVLQLTITYLNS